MNAAYLFDQNVEFLRIAFWQIIMAAGPLLAIALAVGLIIGIIQAATSIQEMTLSFVPKLAVMVLALVLFGGWQISIMVDFFQRIFDRIPQLFL